VGDQLHNGDVGLFAGMDERDESNRVLILSNSTNDNPFCRDISALNRLTVRSRDLQGLTTPYKDEHYNESD
jgi:hypothetical protein